MRWHSPTQDCTGVRIDPRRRTSSADSLPQVRERDRPRHVHVTTPRSGVPRQRSLVSQARSSPDRHAGDLLSPRRSDRDAPGNDSRVEVPPGHRVSFADSPGMVHTRGSKTPCGFTPGREGRPALAGVSRSWPPGDRRVPGMPQALHLSRCCRRADRRVEAHDPSTGRRRTSPRLSRRLAGCPDRQRGPRCTTDPDP